MTLTTPANLPLSVDYTSRDFYAIRNQLIARIQSRLPNWTATDPADFGVALVEAFAYMGDLISYYIDRAANESFITTATQKDSIYNLAQTYGYTPAGYRSATVTLQFTNSSASAISIPAGTVVYGDVITGTSGDVVQQVYFTTTSTVIADPAVNNGIITVSATHGQSVSLVSTNANSVGEYVGASDGTPSQIFQLGESPVVDGTVNVYVQDGSSYSAWKNVQHIIDYGSNEQIFTTFSDANNNVFIQFGDSVSGLIPVNFAQIRVQYTVGGGVIGNVLSQTLTNIEYVPGLTSSQLAAFRANISVTNLSVATGGADPEDVDLIRYLAPITLRSNTRAVTLNDFNSLALTLAGKANAVAGSNWTSVTLYVAPKRVASDTDLQPGLDNSNNPTVEFTTLASNVSTYITPRMLVGTTLSVQPPTYVDIILAIQYTATPGYTTTDVESAIKSAIVNNYGYYNNLFAQVIYQQDIEHTLNSLKQVKLAKVTALHRQGDTGINTLTGAANEIFRFQEGNISIGTI